MNTIQNAGDKVAADKNPGGNSGVAPENEFAETQTQQTQSSIEEEGGHKFPWQGVVALLLLLLLLLMMAYVAFWKENKVQVITTAPTPVTVTVPTPAPITIPNPLPVAIVSLPASSPMSTPPAPAASTPTPAPTPPVVASPARIPTSKSEAPRGRSATAAGSKLILVKCDGSHAVVETKDPKDQVMLVGDCRTPAAPAAGLTVEDRRITSAGQQAAPVPMSAASQGSPVVQAGPADGQIWYWRHHEATVEKPGACVFSSGNGEGRPPFCGSFKIVAPNPGEGKGAWISRVGGGGHLAFDSAAWQKKD